VRGKGGLGGNRPTGGKKKRQIKEARRRTNDVVVDYALRKILVGMKRVEKGGGDERSG